MMSHIDSTTIILFVGLIIRIFHLKIIPKTVAIEPDTPTN